MNITVDPGALVTTITIVAGITIFSFLKSRHIERMQQLQLGIPLGGQQNGYFELKIGSMFIGIGLGILVAYILEYFFSRSTDELYPAFIFLFGGIGLVISYLYIKQLKEKV